jgi:epoxyqueuosine reductase
MNYYTLPLPSEPMGDPGRGIIARYAWGDDYHDVLLPRLQQLGAFVQSLAGGTAGFRACVDSGPVLERELGARAGLGFVGKNTHLIHPRLGSWFFLGELLLTAALPAQETISTQGTCGGCTRCLEACPTAALVAPYVLDARRCISYLTIELKGPIPAKLRPLMGNRIFGCDICQEVCPWNQAPPLSCDPAWQPRPAFDRPRLHDLAALDDEALRRALRGTAMTRTRVSGFRRNLVIALDNAHRPEGDHAR